MFEDDLLEYFPLWVNTPSEIEIYLQEKKDDTMVSRTSGNLGDDSTGNRAD